MKKLVAKFFVVCLAFCALIFTLGAAACAPTQKQAGGLVVHRETGLMMITITEAEEGATLKDAMDKMQANGEIFFEEDGMGMVISIDGHAASGNCWWGLYTTDVEFDMGYPEYNFFYEDEEYYIASLGYASLPVAVGETYVWHYVG